MILPPREQLDKMRGGDVLALLRDALNEEADRVENQEAILTEIGHRPLGALADRDALARILHAAAKLIDEIIIACHDASLKQRTPPAIVMTAIDAARNELVAGAVPA